MERRNDAQSELGCWYHNSSELRVQSREYVPNSELPTLNFELATSNSLKVFIKPRYPSLQSVALVAWHADAMELSGIDDELCGHAECAQRLIHLFAACGGHVEIFFAAEKKCGRFYFVGFEQRVRNLDVRAHAFPRRPDFIIVLIDVLVNAIKRKRETRACATARGFEACVGSDEIIGEYAAIAPSCYAEFIGVGDSFFDEVINSAVQVDDFFVAPVGRNYFAKRQSPSVASAIIYGNNLITARSKHLPG